MRVWLHVDEEQHIPRRAAVGRRGPVPGNAQTRALSCAGRNAHRDGIRKMAEAKVERGAADTRREVDLETALHVCAFGWTAPSRATKELAEIEAAEAAAPAAPVSMAE